jgi:2-polyprenyl-3-methyl-5-hydroxy-6-metoxy-1,4-benzoquinol methylase
MCLFSFANPFPEKQALATYYADRYRAEGTRHRLNHEPGPWDGAYVRARSQLEFVFSRATSTSDPSFHIKSWLDVGAGYGCLLDVVKKEGIKRTGAIEPDKHSRARLERQGHEIYDDLSHAAGVWDVISFSHLLEHLSSPIEFLTRVREVLSNSGHIFCEVPNVANLESETNDAPHLLFFTIPSLVRLFETVGFKVLTVKSCGSPAQAERSSDIQQLFRRVALRLFEFPPAWLDRIIHPHFRYSTKGNRVWIRLLARKDANDSPTMKRFVASYCDGVSLRTGENI